MLTVAAVCGGDVAVIWVALTTTTLLAGTVPNRHLDDCEAQLPGRERDEPVHPAELQRQRHGDGPREHSQRAARVTDRVAEQHAAAEAPDTRTSAPDEAVAAIAAAISLDHVGITAAEPGDHRRNVGGVVLAVGVEHDDDLAASNAETRVERRGLPAAAIHLGVQFPDDM